MSLLIDSYYKIFSAMAFFFKSLLNSKFLSTTIKVRSILLFCFLLTVVNTSCVLNTPGRVYNVYECTATLRNNADEIETVSSSESRFSGEALPANNDCGMTTAEDIEAYWLRLIKRVTDTDWTFVGRGANWCAESFECHVLGIGPWPPEECPPAVVDDEGDPVESIATDCPPLSNRCLTLSPPPNPEEPDFQSWLDFGELEVNAFDDTQWVTILNEDCRADVRIRAEMAIEGVPPTDFSVFANTCARDNPVACMGGDEEACWHTLPVGEMCELNIHFYPTAHGPKAARYEFLRDVGSGRRPEVNIIALRGRGIGGTLEAPTQVCLDELVGPWTDECEGNQGTAKIPITISHSNGPAVQINQVYSPNQAFWFDNSGLPIIIPAGGTAILEVLWCAYAGDSNDIGSLELETNGANNTDGTISIPLERTTGRCH